MAFTKTKKYKPFDSKVWLSSPTMHNGEEMKYVQEAYDTNWMSTVGININEVEKKGNRGNMMEKRTISFSPPDITELEIAEVAEALRSGWITTEPRTKMLECRLAAYIETGKTDIDCSTREAIAKYSQLVVCLNSATAAEELNLRILGVGPGDEVMVA